MTLLENQKRFINLRLGTFIHFNSATFQFNSTTDVEDWEFGHENFGQERKYPFCGKDWNPTELDCREWARAAKEAGCRFAALTAKHHEGFVLWDSKCTEHCIRNAANKTDVVRQYLEAFREQGIAAGLYFSILDLTHGIGRKSCTLQQKQFIKDQISELLTSYGEIPFLMVDGWGSPWGGPSFEMLPFEEIDSHVKSLQKDCLLLNIGASDGLDHTDIVFFENAAGQEVASGFSGPGVSCNKLTRTWFWRHDDPVTPCTEAAWAIGKMKEYFPINVNFMLNLSPNVKGKIDDNLKREFARIGERVALPDELMEEPKNWLKRE